MNKERATIVLFLLISLAVSWFCGSDVSYHEQSKLLSSLQTISAIIFGVMGAWIAIIYPDSLKNVFNWHKDTQIISDSLNRIFVPVRNSTIIVLLTLAIEWGAIIVSRIPSIEVFTSELRAALFFVLSFLVQFQIYSLILTFKPMANAEDEVIDKLNDRKTIETKRGRAKVVIKDSNDETH